jgi:hypothetical protein
LGTSVPFKPAHLFPDTAWRTSAMPQNREKGMRGFIRISYRVDQKSRFYLMETMG